MKEKNSRQSFLKNLTIGGFGITAMPGALLAEGGKPAIEKDLDTPLQKTGKAQKPGGGLQKSINKAMNKKERRSFLAI